MKAGPNESEWRRFHTISIRDGWLYPRNVLITCSYLQFGFVASVLHSIPLTLLFAYICQGVYFVNLIWCYYFWCASNCQKSPCVWFRTQYKCVLYAVIPTKGTRRCAFPSILGIFFVHPIDTISQVSHASYSNERYTCICFGMGLFPPNRFGSHRENVR